MRIRARRPAGRSLRDAAHHSFNRYHHCANRKGVAQGLSKKPCRRASGWCGAGHRGGRDIHGSCDGLAQADVRRESLVGLCCRVVRVLSDDRGQAAAHRGAARARCAWAGGAGCGTQGGFDDRGSRHAGARRGGCGASRGGDGGRKRIRRCGGAAAVYGVGRRAGRRALQGGQHDGLHGGLQERALSPLWHRRRAHRRRFKLCTSAADGYPHVLGGTARRAGRRGRVARFLARPQEARLTQLGASRGRVCGRAGRAAGRAGELLWRRAR